MDAGDDNLERIKQLAERMADLRPANDDETTLLAFMAATLYGLVRAAELRFDDALIKPDPADARDEVRSTLSGIVEGSAPSEPWLSGYHVDSALLRLMPLNERANKHLGLKPDLDSAVAGVAKAMKHHVGAGITKGWPIGGLANVLDATESLADLLERAIDR